MCATSYEEGAPARGDRPQWAEVAVGQSPLEAAIGKEAVDRDERALAALTPDEREAVIGRMEMGDRYNELAELLGKPTADAARKAAQRAIVRLTRQMNLPGT